MFDDNQNNTGQPPQNLPTAEPEDMFAGVEDRMTDNSGVSTPQPTPVSPSPSNAIDAGLLKKKTEINTSLEPGNQNIDPDLARVSEGQIPPSNATVRDNTQSVSPDQYKVKEPILGKVILVILIIALVSGLGFIGFWFYNNYTFGDTPEPVDNNVITVPVLPETEKPDINLPVETPEPVEDFNQIPSDITSDEVLFGEPMDSDKDGLDDDRERELGTRPDLMDTDDDEMIDYDEVVIWKTDPLNPDTDGDGYKDGVEVRNGYNPSGDGRLFDLSELNEEDTKATSTDFDGPETSTSTS